AGTGDGQVPDAGLEAAFKDVAGTVDVDIVVAAAILRGLQHGGQMHHMGDLLAVQQLSQLGGTDIQYMDWKSDIVAAAQVGTHDLQVTSQAVAELMADIASGAGNEDARGHVYCSLAMGC